MKRLPQNLARTCATPVLWIGVALVAALSGCSTTQKGDGARISKVRYFHLEPGQEFIPSADPMVDFEPRYRLYGAVTAEERSERNGHYYTVWWKVKDRSQPVTVRFEYRQKEAATEVRSIEREVADPGRNNKTYFEITGMPYFESGPVIAHRVVLVQGGRELVDWKSYLWE